MLHTSFSTLAISDSSRQKRRRSSIPNIPQPTRGNTHQHRCLELGRAFKCWLCWMVECERQFAGSRPTHQFFFFWKISRDTILIERVFCFPQNPPPVWSHHQFLGLSSVWTNPTSIAALLRRGELSMPDLLRVRLVESRPRLWLV